MDQPTEKPGIPGLPPELSSIEFFGYLANKSAVEYFTRGGARYAAGRPAEALADFEKVLALEPDNENAKLMRDLISRQL